MCHMCMEEPQTFKNTRSFFPHNNIQLTAAASSSGFKDGMHPNTNKNNPFENSYWPAVIN